jgi:hypothetical protein
MSVETKHSPSGTSKSTDNIAEQLRNAVVLQSLQLELCIQRYRSHVGYATANIPENASFEEAESYYHKALESEDGRRLFLFRELVRYIRSQFHSASLVAHAATASGARL